MAEIGSLLHDRYRIIDVLGRGGMGAVYRAKDEVLSVDVAVKENSIKDDEASRQFLREATILARMRHANLPRVTDHFVIPGQGQYLVMDYVDGEDLRHRMERQGAIPENEVILIGIALCEALVYLHNQNPPVIHRDLKPGNIKVTPSGQVFLVDFGLAKIVEGSQETTTGAKGLSPGYSPPEQYGAARTDQRSDIYSLGATLYAFLTGKQPEDGLEIMIQQTKLTKIRDHNPKINRKLAVVIEKSLNVLPEDRFQKAIDFQQALLEASDTVSRKVARGEVNLPPASGTLTKKADLDTINPTILSVPAASKRKRKQRKRPILWFVLFSLVCLISAFAIFFLRPDLIPTGWIAQAQRATVVDSAISPLSTATHKPIDISPIIGPTTSIAATSVPTGIPTRRPNVAPTETKMPVATPRWGGALIAFASNRANGTGKPQVYIHNLRTGDLIQLTDKARGACQPSWSPDGQRLVFISPCDRNQIRYPGSSLYIMNADGSDEWAIPTEPGGDYDPEWSPVDNRIVFTSEREFSRPSIFVYDVDTGETTNLTQIRAYDYQPSWSPDGKLIIFMSNRVVPSQVWYMEAETGRPWDLVSRDDSLIYANPFWTLDGEEILFTQYNNIGLNLSLLKSLSWNNGVNPGYGEKLIYDIGVGIWEAAFSPDGTGMVFVSTDVSGNQDIYVANYGSLDWKRLTISTARDFDPDWGPVLTPSR